MKQDRKYFLEIQQGGGSTCIAFMSDDGDGARIAGSKCNGGGSTTWKYGMDEAALKSAVSEFRGAIKYLQRKRREKEQK